MADAVAAAPGAARAGGSPGTPALGERRSLSLKLTMAARQLHRRFDQSVAEIGITRSQWTMIAVVSRYAGITQREIAQKLEMSEASAGRLVDRLCGEGLLVRRAKEDDRRAYCVHLTDTAGAMLEKISRIARIQEDRVFAGLDQDDLARLEDYLDRIAANVAGPA